MADRTIFAEAVASIQAPNGPRAVLISLDRAGQPKAQPVERGQSVLRVDTQELFDHLNAAPCDTEFLLALRDYAEGRLAARVEANQTEGFVIQRAPGRWEIAHVSAFPGDFEVSHD